MRGARGHGLEPIAFRGAAGTTPGIDTDYVNEEERCIRVTCLETPEGRAIPARPSLHIAQSTPETGHERCVEVGSHPGPVATTCNMSMGRSGAFTRVSSYSVAS